jgi:hypothetical protein
MVTDKMFDEMIRLRRREHEGSIHYTGGLIDTPLHKPIKKPWLPQSKKYACLEFIRFGSNCKHGNYCSEAHVTLQHSCWADLKAISDWVDDTPDVTWHGTPPRF